MANKTNVALRKASATPSNASAASSKASAASPEPETRKDKKPCVLLGVTGCIAAYKACEIVRGLQKHNIRVKVIMTKHATHFIDPTTFRALTHEPVALELFDEPGDAIHHISLAKECDLFLVAPATANVIAKMATGIADDLFTTTALATQAPILIAPAMNTAMYEHLATQNNMRTLRERGAHFIEAEKGYLACGDEGRGRLAQVEDIVDAALGFLFPQRDLEGVNVLITAGPTIEPIDSVRFISNYSSGKMGYSLAEVAHARGGQVTLVSGPVSLDPPAGVDVRYIKSACEMDVCTQEAFSGADIAIFCAAVADFRPKNSCARKLKKARDVQELTSISLVENPDILKNCAAKKTNVQVVVGFAAETDDLLKNARDKLKDKHADMIVGNVVGENKGFAQEENEVQLVFSGKSESLPKMPKTHVAAHILDAALSLREQKLNQNK